MAEKKQEIKITLEREYTVPLRKGFAHVPYYKRTPKAIKTLREFIAKHMKVEDHDTRKVLIDKYLNLQFWHRGIRKPPAKIRVKAKKYDDGTVRVELVDIHETMKWKMKKEEKLSEEAKKAKEKAEAEQKKEEKEEKPETKEEAKEKEEKKESVIEAGLKQQDQAHKEQKHEVMQKKNVKQPLARKALKK